jgi:hypothetical protein
MGDKDRWGMMVELNAKLSGAVMRHCALEGSKLGAYLSEKARAAGALPVEALELRVAEEWSEFGEGGVMFRGKRVTMGQGRTVLEKVVLSIDKEYEEETEECWCICGLSAEEQALWIAAVQTEQQRKEKRREDEAKLFSKLSDAELSAGAEPFESALSEVMSKDLLPVCFSFLPEASLFCLARTSVAWSKVCESAGVDAVWEGLFKSRWPEMSAATDNGDGANKRSEVANPPPHLSLPALTYLSPPPSTHSCSGTTAGPSVSASLG